MIKTFVDIFAELADEADKVDARRTAKALLANGVHSLQQLLKTEDSKLAEMKGIGPRSMHIIGYIKTKEEFKAKKQMTAYKKMKGKQIPKDFKYYLQRAGATYLESCNIERIVKREGCKDMDEFTVVGIDAYKGWRGIGPKRYKKLVAAREMILAEKK